MRLREQYAETAYELPAKIEQRLGELVQIGEFDQEDVAHCRASYWTARDDWHKILVDCYEIALRRRQSAIFALGDPISAAQRSATH